MSLAANPLSRSMTQARPKTSLVPTAEQYKIIEAMPEPESTMIQALAGTGKTSTLEMAGTRIKVPALALAFNKSIAVELEKRFEANFTVKTMNGLGHGAWLRANPSIMRAEVDANKLGKLVTALAKERKVDLSSDQWGALRQLVSRAMQCGLVLDSDSGLIPDSDESWSAIAEDLDMTPAELEFFGDMPRQLLRNSVALARRGIISFDDQVYCSTMLGGRFPQFPVVFVDESQDLSPLNHKMLALSMRPEGKLVSCGDSRQAIYQFRGASVDSMSRIEGLRPSWTKLPLATTFRCPKVIVARQQEHAPGYTAYSGNPDGAFFQFQPPTMTDTVGEMWGWTFADLQGRLPRPGASMAVLCRNNSPLFSLAFKLLRQGVGVVMLGRDIGKNLEVLSRKIAAQDEMPRDQVAGAIVEWRETEISLALAQGKDEKVASITDRAECLLAVLSNSEARDAGQLRAMLHKLFERESSLVTLSSIHKAKGLEWDLVLHLDPWRIPSRYAREAAKRGDASQLEQEWNLRYVCETRTKHTLVNANLDEFRSV